MAAACVRRFGFCNFRVNNSQFRSSSAFLRHFSDSGNSNGPKFRHASVGPIALGVAGGALLGVGISWKKFQNVKPPVLNDAVSRKEVLLPELPDVKVARKITSATDPTNLQLVLFQYPTCPFCCKVRAFLDYYGFSYDVVEVDPVLRREMSWSEYKKVPILLAKVDGGYQQLNDSSMIVSALRSYLQDLNTPLPDVVKNYPVMEFRDDNGYLKSEIMNRYFLMYHGVTDKSLTNERIVEERYWRKWADDNLVHTLSPNVYRTREEALQAFNWFSEVGEWDRLFPAWERNLIVYAGALAMWGIGKRLKKRHNLKDDVRQSLYDSCNQWMAALNKKGTPFMGGSTPDLSDLAVYGVLSSIEGCTAFSDLKNNTRIAKWYYPMQEAVRNHQGVPEIR